MFQEMIRQIQRAETISYTGKIENIVGMSIEASGGRAAMVISVRSTTGTRAAR